MGLSLQSISKNFPSLEITATDVEDLDITSDQAVNSFFKLINPDFIVNCAAYTAVDDAENDEEGAFRINKKGPAVLAKNCMEMNIPLIHVSTDYVFSGNADSPYRETDQTNPLTVYGRSKLEGEKAVLKSGANGLIIRTSWLYSEYGSNFLKTMIHLGKNREKVRVVSDQKGSPTYAGALASGIIHMINFYPDEIKSGLKNGIYHFSNLGECSWFEFAAEIMKVYGLKCGVEAVNTEEFPRPAPRPAYSVMNTDRFAKEFNFDIPHWKDSLNSCIRNLKN